MPRRIGSGLHRRHHFIKEWREFRGLSQEYLADKIGTTKTSISRIESLKQPYTQDVLEAIADVMGAHPGTLLSRAPTPADGDAPSDNPRNPQRPKQVGRPTTVRSP